MLAIIYERLEQLRKNPQFAATIARKPATPESLACEAGARADPSGRVFDLARCARIWPEDDKANYIKQFETTFRRSVQTHGTQAFPAARIETFDFTLRLKASELPAESITRSEAVDDASLEVAPKTKEVLCNPRITFVARDKCEVNVVWRQGIHQSDIFVSQTGYRLELENPIPLAVAVELRSALLKNLPLPPSTPADAVRVLLFGASKPAQEQAQATPVEPKSGAAESRARVVAYWRSLGLPPDSLRLAEPAGTRPPPILIFDSPVLAAPKPIGEWLRNFQLDSDCLPEKIDGFSHTEAVASLLFPGALASDPVAPARMTWIPASWSGFFLSPTHFEGQTTFETGQRWYEPTIYGSGGDPLVAVAVFSRRLGDFDQGKAEDAARTYLANASNILVVSAPERVKYSVNTLSFSGDEDIPRTEPSRIEELCAGRLWPACLGRHPRVLVVGPAEYSQLGFGPAPSQFADYFLGASTIRLLAPAVHVPVAARCLAGAGQDKPQWALSQADGTSYAAPIVALVISRMLQLGANNLRLLPEAAIWRVLATSVEVAYPAGTGRSQQAQFGALNAGKALMGISSDELGAWDASSVYARDDAGAGSVFQAVVMPFPWSDQQLTLLSSGIASNRRGAITFSAARDAGFAEGETVAFERVLRITRRPNDEVVGVPLFDIHLLETTVEPSLTQSRRVVIRRRVRLGSSDAVAAQGFCRIDQAIPGSESGKLNSQSQPACLYVWRNGTPGFVPLNLRDVDDIVLPPLHIASNWPGNIDPTDITQVTRPGSPWATEFCATGPRALTEKLLMTRYKQPSRSEACPQ